MTVTFTNHFQLETDLWDALMATSARASSQPLKVELPGNDDASDIKLRKERTHLKETQRDEAMSSEHEEEEDHTTSDEAQDQAASASDTDEPDYRDKQEYEKYTPSVRQERSKKWWERKRRGIQGRHEKAMKYVASHNVTLLSSLKERAPAFLLVGAQNLEPWHFEPICHNIHSLKCRVM